MEDFTKLVSRVEQLLTKLEALFHACPEPVDWEAQAWRWVMQGNQGNLQAVAHPQQISLENIQFVDAQKSEIVRNTRQFLQGFTANHVLLTGARGTGKSSLVKALLHEYSAQGLRLIEVEKHDLIHLNQIVTLVRNRKEKIIIFCDDLSFEANDVGYKALKVVLDGSIAGNADNLLIYATSNRKNLMPEFMRDNVNANDEIRPNETLDEKVALAERFGLWLSFYPFDQDEYLAICKGWLATLDVPWNEVVSAAALNFSHTRGMRSGRVAYQFARDYAGKLRLK